MLTLLSLISISEAQCYAQKIALKTYIICDALLPLDLGIETKLAPRLTSELTDIFNFLEVINTFTTGQIRDIL